MKLTIVRLQALAGLAVLGAGCLTVAAIVATSLDRRLYFADQEERGGWEHPTGGVVLVALAAALETAVAYAVLVTRSPGRTWVRALLGLALMAPLGLVVSEVVVQAPVFWLVHAAWVWLVSVALAIAVLASGAAELLAFVRGRRQGA
jgi:hypothetical protein